MTVCKNLLRSDGHQRNHSKAKFPSNLNCEQKSLVKRASRYSSQLIVAQCTISPHTSGSILALVMVYCLMALIHFLNKCGIFICEILWHSHESDFTTAVQITILCIDYTKLDLWICCQISQRPMSLKTFPAFFQTSMVKRFISFHHPSTVTSLINRYSDLLKWNQDWRN